MPGIEAVVKLRGLTALFAWRGRRSSTDKGSPDTGHFPVSKILFWMSDRSNKYPVFFETTGSVGVCPDIQHCIFSALFCPFFKNPVVGI
jgi:hypothetical protein